MLPLRARVDLGAMVMKGYSAFPKVPAFLERLPSDSLVSYLHTRWEVLSLCRDAVGVFCRCSWLRQIKLGKIKNKVNIPHNSASAESLIFGVKKKKEKKKKRLLWAWPTFWLTSTFGSFLKWVVHTGWNDKIIVLKKTTLQLYFKTFIEKISSGNLIML